MVSMTFVTGCHAESLLHLSDKDPKRPQLELPQRGRIGAAGRLQQGFGLAARAGNAQAHRLVVGQFAFPHPRFSIAGCETIIP